MKSEILAYLENIESRREAKTGSAPMDVDALAAAASQTQASLASLAKPKEKAKVSKVAKEKERSKMEARETTKVNRREKVRVGPIPVHGNNSWSESDWY